MQGKFVDDDVLRKNLDAVIAGPASQDKAWYNSLEAHLSKTQGADENKLRDPEFLKLLFDDNAVSAVGNGTVKIAPALSNPEFVDWFAKQASLPLPETPLEVETYLINLFRETASRLGELCGRTPWLKLSRALCALFPDYFTTIADGGKLRYLYREMGGNQQDLIVHIHIAIRRRIDEILGPPVQNLRDRVRRLCLPWFLFMRLDEEKGESMLPSKYTLPNSLVPLPATLRRKGLTAMKGNFQTLLGFLPALNDGVTREEFRDLIRQANPDLAETSIGPAINVVMREFDLCKNNDDVYRLSPRGINLLESQDPQELADHLLTKVLGVDFVIRTLSKGPKGKAELIIILQSVNPGWTSSYAPSAMLGWLVSMNVIGINSKHEYELTDSGQRWNEMISWDPPTLPKVAETVAELQATVDEGVVLPVWELLTGRLSELAGGKLRWDGGLIRQLHAGLWFHPVRHFAVLAGLSGSGKTQLALNYAKALCGEAPTGLEAVKVIPVQPGWFDTSPLLGYVHPIQQATYVGTPFLDLLLRAVDNPGLPYVVILDEMNLSHPEQYLAPILSAMETHGVIELHQMDEDSCGVPRSIKYPANLVLIGTVNMDETTHGLSDKVLDRAFTLEFWDINVADFPKWGDAGLSDGLREKTKAVLEALIHELAPIRQHFGWRTIDDVVSYLAFATGLGIAEVTALDDVLYAKVLPKLRGERSERFEKALNAVGKILGEHQLLRCREKLKSMRMDLDEAGVTRFWR